MASVLIPALVPLHSVFYPDVDPGAKKQGIFRLLHEIFPVLAPESLPKNGFPLWWLPEKKKRSPEMRQIKSLFA
ncbi:hypothetical protein B4096_2637 [Heyndrickxia coagulans]|nr:hypothetical protein B4096_2637 [Heyndrickxia coagulans]